MLARIAHIALSHPAKVMIHEEWGFINAAGRLVVPVRFDDVQPFEDGVACVKLNDKMLLIDRSSKVIWQEAEAAETE